MGMKFLNKKGWHTGSLRNIENVWKAEQKHDAEQKKLEELRKQIREERERSEFRLLQERAGLVPRQERLEFLYESGLAVGKGSSSNSDGFKAALESSSSLPPSSDNPPSAPSSSAATQQQQPSMPGALFEEKPQSANDAWRKLHSDPLLLIRQREQESLARVKNNPVQMAIIRNSVEATKSKEKSQSKDLREKKRHKKKHKHRKYSSSSGEEERTDVRVGKRSSKGDELSDKMDNVSGREQRNNHPKDSSPSGEEEERSTYSRLTGKSSKDERLGKMDYVSEIEERKIQRSHHRDHRDSPIEEEQRLKRNRGAIKSSNSDKHVVDIDYVYGREDKKRNSDKDMYRKQPASVSSSIKDGDALDGFEKNLDKPKYEKRDNKLESQMMRMDYESDKKRRREEEDRRSHYQEKNTYRGPPSKVGPTHSVHHEHAHHHVRPSKLSSEEKAARLKEMQMDAELHEESRWKRIKKADEIDTMQEAAEAAKSITSGTNSRNFLDAAKRNVYGAEKGGSTTIEESVRRRKYYMQNRSEVGQGNAFRR